MIPFIDLKRFEDGFLEKWADTSLEITRNTAFIGGPLVSILEERLSEYCGVEYSVTCANGTDALQLALRGVGVGANDKVLVPNMTFWATFEAVVNVGASPVTVDVSMEDGCLELEALRVAIRSERPKAAILVHLYGWGSSNLAEIRKLCRDESVILIEDGAQSFGTLWRNSSIYKDAVISTTSFYPAKVLGAAGDAGAVFTNDPELSEKVRCLANHGRSSHYGYSDVGWNSRMDALQAAYLSISIDYLEERIGSRRRSAEYYRKELRPLGANVLKAPTEFSENGYCNVIFIEDPEVKQNLEVALKAASIGYGNIYPSPMSAQFCSARYSKIHYGGENAAKICKQVLNLPLFPYMSNEELYEVVSVVKSAISNQLKRGE